MRATHEGAWGMVRPSLLRACPQHDRVDGFVACDFVSCPAPDRPATAAILTCGPTPISSGKLRWFPPAINVTDLSAHPPRSSTALGDAGCLGIAASLADGCCATRLRPKQVPTPPVFDGHRRRVSVFCARPLPVWGRLSSPARGHIQTDLSFLALKPAQGGGFALWLHAPNSALIELGL